MRSRVKKVAGQTTVYIGNYFEWSGSSSTMVKRYYVDGERVAVRVGTQAAQPLLTD